MTQRVVSLLLFISFLLCTYFFYEVYVNYKKLTEVFNIQRPVRVSLPIKRLINENLKLYMTENSTDKSNYFEQNLCNEENCLKLPLKFTEIESQVWKILIAIEDHRYINHIGVDLFSILRAIMVNLKAGRFVQGGSTLTQQIIKNTVLTNKKTIKRKIIEGILSIIVEKKYSKKEIMGTYLSHVYWGTQQGLRLYGLKAASWAYFHKKPIDLEKMEILILVALLKGPHYYSPTFNLNRLRERIKAIIKQLNAQNKLERIKDWNNQKWIKWSKILKLRGQKRDLWIIAQTLLKGGDSGTLQQNYAMYQAIFSKQKILNSPEWATMAIIGKLDNSSTQSLYFHKLLLSSEKKIGKRQIGSLLKPLVYTYFRQMGKSWELEIDASSLSLPLKNKKTWTLKGLKDGQKVTMKKALQKSLNTPFIRIVEEVGWKKVENFIIMTLGLKTLKRPLRDYPSQLLGSLSLTPKELWHLYRVFIKNSCEGIFDFGHEVIQILTESEKTTIKNYHIGQIRNFSIFGKTGTSNDGRDNWFIGFDGLELVLLWSGFLGSWDKPFDKSQSGAKLAFPVYASYLINSGKLPLDWICVGKEFTLDE